MKPQFKYFNFFSMLYMTLALTDMILIYRMASIGSYTISVGVFVMAILYFTEDLIAEVYGYNRVRQTIWFMLILCFIFSIIVTVLNMLPYPVNWHNKPDFDLIIGHVFRINLMGGGLALMGGAFINGYIISKWKVLTAGKYFIIRSILSSAIGELIQNIIGVFVLYWGIYTPEKMLSMILPMYFTQIIAGICITVPGILLINVVKHIEGGEIFDTNIRFNPFSLELDDETETFRELVSSKT